MLSRVASALYWIGRHLERGEHVARLLDVHTYQMLDNPMLEREQIWRVVLELCDREGRFAASSLDYDTATVGEFLAASEDNPNSVMSCVVTARELARSVRESISSEMWEHLNRMYWQVQAEGKVWSRNSHAYFNTVKTGCHLFEGLTDDTMNHDDGWRFLRLGKFFERAENTIRLVDVNRFNLSGKTNEDPQAWAVLLKSCSAFEAFRRGRSRPIDPESVVQFLLFNAAFPRSSLFCAMSMARSIEALSSGTTNRDARVVQRSVGRLRAMLEYADPDMVLQQTDVTFFPGLLATCKTVDMAIDTAYFHGGRLVTTDTFAAPQQQQQQ